MNERVLAGRTAIVTGASQGLGRAIARAYVNAGANVALCSRDVTVLEDARKELAGMADPDQRVLAWPLDVSDERAVAAAVSALLAQFGRIHILVNNAGIYGPKGRIEDVDWAEWKRAIDINLHGSILMCRALLPHFRQHRYGKIVQISGGGATNPMPRLSAYAASKAAVVRFAETLAGEVVEDGITVNCVAPGALNTRMLDEVLEAGPAVVGQAFYDRAVKQKQQGGASPEKGAALAVFLGAAASDGITGKLLSALWDPWQSLPNHAAQLRESDIYTLRRIVPADRDAGWGA